MLLIGLFFKLIILTVSDFKYFFNSLKSVILFSVAQNSSNLSNSKFSITFNESNSFLLIYRILGLKSKYLINSLVFLLKFPVIPISSMFLFK